MSAERAVAAPPAPGRLRRPIRKARTPKLLSGATHVSTIASGACASASSQSAPEISLLCGLAWLGNLRSSNRLCEMRFSSPVLPAGHNLGVGSRSECLARTARSRHRGSVSPPLIDPSAGRIAPDSTEHQVVPKRCRVLPRGPLVLSRRNSVHCCGDAVLRFDVPSLILVSGCLGVLFDGAASQGGMRGRDHR